MPARLPDEELAPVQGGTPTLAGVAPTTLGTNVAADELGHATSIAYRAAGLATRAQTALDQKSVQPALEQVAATYTDNLGQLKTGYKGEAGLADRAAEQGLQIRTDAREKYLPGMSPGQMQQFNAGLSDLSNAHQAGALKIQNDYQEAVRSGLQANQDTALYNTGWLPVSQQLKVVSQGIIGNLDKVPNPGQQFATDAAKVSDAGFAQFVQANNLTPAQSTFYKRQWDHDVQQEITQGSGRIGDAVTHYQQGLVTTSAMQGINGVVGGFAASPETYLPSMVKGGDFDRAVSGLPADLRTPDVMLRLREEAASSALQGLTAQQKWSEASDLLKNPQVRADLGDKVAVWENELAKYGPNAIARDTAAASLGLRQQQDFEHRAAEGGSIYTPADLATLQQSMSPQAFAEYQARANIADQVFARLGKPISQMTQQELQRVPQPTDSAAPDYQASKAAWDAAQGEIAAWTKDPAAMVMGLERSGVSTPGGAKPAKGEMGAMGNRVTGELAALPVNGAIDQGAGSTFSHDMLQAQANAGLDSRYRTFRLLPQAVAAQRVAALEQAPPEAKLNAMLGLRGWVNSLPDAIQIADGTTFHPKAMAIRELTQAGLKPGDAAAMVYSTMAGGDVGLGRYAGAINNPDLRKPLDKADADALLGAVNGQLAKLVATNLTAGDQQMTPALRDYVYAQARFLRAQNPQTSWQDAAAQAAASVTSGFRYDHAIRMPLALSQQKVGDVAPVAASDAAVAQGRTRFGASLAGAPATGWDSARAGMAQARTWALANDGANLGPPPSALGAGESARLYASQIARSGYFTNWDDNNVALVVPRPDGQVEVVRDRYGRPILMNFKQAIDDGQTGHSTFESPPPMALRTPAGHPVNAASPPVAAAAAAGAIAGGGYFGPAAARAMSDAALGGAPASAVAPPPPPGSQVPSGSQGTESERPTRDAGSPSVPPAAMNATQRALAAVGASPQVLAMFAGAGADAAPPAAAPMGYERLNVTPSQATAAFLPAVIHAEHGGGGAVSPKGAVGVMQLMPDTVKDWAPRLGLPVDVERARTDPAYNQAIGTALLNHLFAHYMTGGHPQAGMALALAGYNAGPGAIEGYVKNGVHHPGWLTTIGDPRAGTMTADQWVAKIPYRDTRAYVRQIMDETTRRLAGVVGAGPSS